MRVVCPPEPTLSQKIKNAAALGMVAGGLASIFAVLFAAWIACP